MNRLYRLISAGALCLVAGMFCAQPANAAITAKQYWEKGLQEAGNRLYIDAVASYSQAIRMNKGEIGMADVARIFHHRGEAYAGMKDDEKALSDFGNAISMDDTNPEFYLSRGALYLEREKFELAQEDFGAAVKLDPKNGAAYARRGQASLAAGDHDRAIGDFEAVLGIEPKNSAVLYPLGLAYKRSGKTDKALATFNALLEREPTHPLAPYQEAAIFARAGKIDSACVWLDAAVENGFRNWPALKQDPDFDNLRKVDCYRRHLVGK